jgi:hypothetical protein
MTPIEARVGESGELIPDSMVGVGTTEHGDVVFVDPEIVMEVLLGRASSRRAKMAELEGAKNRAYEERNRVLVLLAALVRLIPGWDATRAEHDPADQAWEEDWRCILVIDSPAGQMTWHFHDDERPLLEDLPVLEDYVWDGHSTEEKYRRVAKSADIARALLVAPPDVERPKRERKASPPIQGTRYTDSRFEGDGS